MKSLLRLALVAALGAVLAACSPRSQPQGAPPPPKVTVSHPHTARVMDWDEFPARLEAVEKVEIKAQVGGYLESIHFQEGTEVKAGDLLFVIDPRPYQATFDQQEAEVNRTETRLGLAESELRRAETLRGSKAISDEELDSRANAVRDAKAALSWSKAGLATARLNLGFTRITAPINGRIGRRLVTAGNLIQANQSSDGSVLATIVSVAPIYCSFDADERVFLRYRQNGGAQANGDRRIPCELALANEDKFSHVGLVDFYDNHVDPKSGTIRVRAVFENADRFLVPGLFARVRIPAGPTAETLLVPEVAINSDQNMKFVLTVNATNFVEMRPVTVGRQHGSDRAILGGLTPQDRIIVNGMQAARPGTPVDPQEASTVTNAAAKVTN